MYRIGVSDKAGGRVAPLCLTGTGGPATLQFSSKVSDRGEMDQQSEHTCLSMLLVRLPGPPEGTPTSEAMTADLDSAIERAATCEHVGMITLRMYW